MNYAIIAAGEGSRLRQEGFKSVKPLVEVCGEHLIERLIRIFKSNDAEQISVIINEESQELKTFLDSRNWGIKINLIVKSTPSSLHSFWNIVKNSDFTECCLTTVDTIFNENEFGKFIAEFHSDKSCDALMGITKYIDDEKPLYVKTDNNNNISAYLDSRENDETDSVSAGIYCLRKKALDIVDSTIKKGVSRMRNYQRALLEDNLKVKSFLFGKVIDIDHLGGIEKAEQLLKKNKTNILSVLRKKEFSPNSEDKDQLILSSVSDNLRKYGYNVVCTKEEDLNGDSKLMKDTFACIISMARGEKAVSILEGFENKGTEIINSVLSIKNCFRQVQTEILKKNNIPIPKTIIVNTSEYLTDKFSQFTEGGFWIKRGDFQTVKEEDVTRPQSFVQAKEVLNNYANRNIKTAILCKHIEGDVIKFYGVRNTDFFFYFYPNEDKFHNRINSSKKRISFDENSFKKDMSRAAELCGLEIYGGDAAIDNSGKYYVIDINDFPSFSSCRQEAAESIANLINNKIENK
ncbi:MAG: NTP transferase domain-containing protein [Bacteroidales bacterium]|nr:NTP transferase domain-containing protein [Bacteroidales bacterium]